MTVANDIYNARRKISLGVWLDAQPFDERSNASKISMFVSNASKMKRSARANSVYTLDHCWERRDVARDKHNFDECEIHSKDIQLMDIQISSLGSRVCSAFSGRLR